jgi:Bifunctional DNA primase/polymerase, N-terminal
MPSDNSELLAAEAIAIRELGGSVVEATDIGTYAIELGLHGWRVHPLRGKNPVLDDWPNKATSDVDTIIGWWAGPYRGYNIGAVITDALMVLDIETVEGHDVDGLGNLHALEHRHNRLPETLTVNTGSGGEHRYFRRPQGKLSGARLKSLAPGVELRASSGLQCVMPPSKHPGTGRRYRWADQNAPVAAPPAWLVELLRPEEPKVASRSTRRRLYALHGPSVADEYTVKATWATILEIHGWHCIDPDPEADGARWVHPSATSHYSATIKHGCLFVYSPNTPFDVTEPGNPKGYTKFRAYAVLDHGGDMTAAAKSLRAASVKP